MKIFTFLFIFSITFNVIAEDSKIIRYNLPTIKTTVIEGEQYKCANIEQWKIILLISSEYQHLYDWKLEINGVLDAHYDLVDLYESALINKDIQIEELEEDRKYLRLRLKQETNLTLNTDKHIKIEKGVLWAVIAVETVIIGIVGIRGATN